jgi:hypothetical protein
LHGESPDFFSSLRWDAGDEGVVIGGKGCTVFEKDLRLGSLLLFRILLFVTVCTSLRTRLVHVGGRS